MGYASHLLPVPSSLWNARSLAALILIFTVASAQDASPPKFTMKPLPLPGANGLVMLDYFAYDRASGRLWVPAGNTGSVDVIDTTTDQIKRLEGFPVAHVELRGKLQPVGPSSVSIGNGVVYTHRHPCCRSCDQDFLGLSAEASHSRRQDPTARLCRGIRSGQSSRAVLHQPGRNRPNCSH
jgi:hypothetical protein